MKLVRLLSNLGYGSRSEVQQWIRSGAVTDLEGRQLDASSTASHDTIRFRGEPLDPASPLTIMLHKPDGFTCSADDPGSVVYDLLPGRFADRKPGLNPVGRLDKDTTGLLLTHRRWSASSQDHPSEIRLSEGVSRHSGPPAEW